MYNEGISREGNLIDVGVNEGVVEKSGAWFSYNDIRLGQGRENSKVYLNENPEIALEIENIIREKYNMPEVVYDIAGEILIDKSIEKNE